MLLVVDIAVLNCLCMVATLHFASHKFEVTNILMAMHRYGMYFKQLSLPTVPPTRPLLMGSNISALVIELMWKRPVGQINSYTITYFPVDNSSAARNISVPSLDADMTWPVRNLLPNTTYQFTLVAVSDAYGSSLPSFPINVTTSLQSGKCIRIL